MFKWFKKKKNNETIIENNNVNNIELPPKEKKIKFTLEIIYYEKSLGSEGCTYTLIAKNKFGIRFALRFTKWFRSAKLNSTYALVTQNDYCVFVRKDIKGVYIKWEKVFE